MAAILLTSDNIDFVKTELRNVSPHLKSSHLTEALAFAVGYSTNAAMLAAIKSAPKSTPILGRLDSLQLSVRLSQLGYSDFDLSSIGGIIRSHGLPERIWVEFSSGDLNMNNYWYRECQERNIPNVRVETRRKYVEVRWDCISIDSRDEAHVRDSRGNTLGKDMLKAYQTIARRIPGNSKFSGSSFVGSIDRLLPELADEMTDIIFAMLYEPMRAQRLVA
ncbi:hypothetical protein NKJ06_09535 [Mesorhizobium sp. M0293]|uniref:hypothetical protein n=1 Tax=Mesorhizobium sp. M0293 TaxID=2956930 RepID=UPI00333BD079